jgi:hypothetical protein
MFYKRKKVVHLNFKNANAANAALAAKALKETKEPTALAAKAALAALAEHIFRLKFEKNMRKLFGMNKKT